VLLNTALVWTVSMREGFIGRWTYFALACDFTLVAGIGVVYSPFLMMPALAIASALAFLTQPTSQRHASVVIAASLAMSAPIALELLGVLPRTFFIEHGAIVIRPWVIGVDPLITPMTLLATGIGTLLGVVVLTLQLKRAQLVAERETHLVTWHLRQLVPEASSPTHDADEQSAR
jgi:hypothetical protein